MRTNKEKEKNKPNVIKGVGGAGLAYSGYRSGIPRLLGIRLERHTTGKSNLDSIFKGKRKGYLDPAKGGTGASTIKIDGENVPEFIKNSRNYVHTTGYHPNTRILQNIPKPLRTLFRKQQGLLYTGVANTKEKGLRQTRLNIITQGLIGRKAKTLYVPGYDKFFTDNFTPDVDDLALKTPHKVPVFKTRTEAVLYELNKRKSTGIRVKDIYRRKAGASLVALGTLGAVSSGNELVKSFKRKGKIVKGYTRKRKSRK